MLSVSKKFIVMLCIGLEMLLERRVVRTRNVRSTYRYREHGKLEPIGWTSPQFLGAGTLKVEHPKKV